ncbi:multidrug effflux MFS transporter [Rhodocytophaga rosea]|uniref:Multidrug effflux MFS transporter n=1 Tax=Rhodocytophaga rosea TaxID=2704465 RepID=A0A6C0GDQ0_9BACT|nr:multidrug effflux MFS transporter [Rhodocytophaga rosea]QHT65892.1 multidrug effflux MFS transporter [Rhodocytophaga rosea]
MTSKQRFTIILILGSLSTISPFSIDMYLPAFPAIAKDLGTTIAQVQLSLTSYLIGISAGQLLYGPLLDRFGRKYPLYAGLAVYLLASLGCALTTSAESLMLMRFIQAVGGCAGMVAAQALVRDIFPVKDTAKVFSLLVLVIAVSPMIAPTLGGYATAVFGWHSIFIILAFITGLILLGIYYVLPEGKTSDSSLSLKPKPVLINFFTVLKQAQFLVYALVGGIASSAPFAFISGSPDVFMNIYKVNEQEFGWIFAFLAFAMIGSSQLNHIFLKWFSSQQLIYIALLYQNIIGVILVTGTYFGWYGQYSLILLMFIFLTGQGLTSPNASALALAPFSKHAGSASALMGSFRMSIGALVSAAVSIWHDTSALPMVGMMGICAVCGLLVLLIGRKTIQHQINKKGVEDEPSNVVI